ncbi:LCP family protein [Sporolactobacillus spathodeae]|uniref:LCP family protein required for cell wall assembly n=1 Tax=Sporolactobacillus spathodeae TaxID=1465502 RepID=A0ABS2Q775_9BACL|nr:LCP family protein [Sporolactobacillus spathodeae]MBM7657270.1 LCP family protein required for cell wall assembly [Sporolactobacillus spathodeae]
MDQTRKTEQQIKKRKRLKKILYIVLAIVLILACSGAAYSYYLTKKLENLANHAQKSLVRGDKSNLRAAKVDPVKDNFTILFMGIDARQKGPSRSDALILATFNHKTKKVKLVSIPRDSKVQIIDPTHQRNFGISKITHAHAYGDAENGHGEDFTIATVEHLFNVPVDYYVQVDFDSFVKIINSLGGVDVKVPVKLVTQNSKDQTGKHAIVLEPGWHKLNGEQALAYVRNRKSPGAGGDFGRGRRQMAVIEAMISKATKLSSITKYSQVIDSLNGHFETNLTFGQLLSLRNYAGALHGIKTLQLKGSDDMSTGVYYFKLDDNYLAKISHMLHQQLGLTDSNSTISGDSSSSSINSSSAAAPSSATSSEPSASSSAATSQNP